MTQEELKEFLKEHLIKIDEKEIDLSILYDIEL